ncbi:MAG TPA: hypothetical protein VN625_04735 [Desulfuromonadaceae bacterium]|nr:hypothetical protein [Desulfuromonadaceae bacterium]
MKGAGEDGQWRMEDSRPFPFSTFHLLSSLLVITTVALLQAGCRTAEPLPAIDVSAPGWHILQGQAVWKPPQNRPELAGDLVLATNANGNFLVQFSKTPFPLATAEYVDHEWEIQFGADKHVWRGSGNPPDRFPWFQLPRALAGDDLNDGWKFERRFGNLWRLENSRTGETLAGEFFP